MQLVKKSEVIITRLGLDAMKWGQWIIILKIKIWKNEAIIFCMMAVIYQQLTPRRSNLLSAEGFRQ